MQFWMGSLRVLEQHEGGCRDLNLSLQVFSGVGRENRGGRVLLACKSGPI